MINELKESLLAAYLQCYNHLDKYRDVEIYCISEMKKDNREGAPRYTADRDQVPGNLATCVIINGSTLEVISNTLISPSFAIGAEVREYQREQCSQGVPLDCRIATKVHGGGWSDEDDIFDTGKIYVSLGENLNECNVITETIACERLNSSSDSEHILINLVDAMLEANFLPQDLMVVIATERIPCESCTRTMLKFLERNAAAKLYVGYTYDTNPSKGCLARSDKEFIKQVRESNSSDRIQLDRVLVENKSLQCFSTRLQIKHGPRA